MPNQYIKNIINAKTIRQLDSALELCLKAEDITHFAFTFYNQQVNSHYILKHSCTGKAYKSWNKHYHEEKYLDTDSTTQNVYNSCIPIYWNLNDLVKTACIAKEKRLRLDSIEYGAEEGISIPVHGPHADFGILVIVKMQGQTFMHNWQDKQTQWMNIALFYFNQLRKLIEQENALRANNKLNQRQIQCLQLTAKNYHIQKIADELNISVRTVNYHLHKANKILGARNKHQAVAIANSLGYLFTE